MSDPGYPLTQNRSTLTYFYSGSDNGVPLSGDGGYWSWIRKYDDKAGQRTAGWPHVHPLPFNSYFRVGIELGGGTFMAMRDVIVSGPKAGTYFVTIDVDPVWLEGSNPSIPFTQGVKQAELDMAYEQLMNQLMDKIASNKTNLGEFFATRQQTVNLVTDTANRIYRAVSALKRGNFMAAQAELARSKWSKKPRWARTIPEQWLALKYGWQPLLGDIKSSAEQLSDVANQFKPECRATARVTCNHDNVVVDNSSNSVPFGIPGGKWEARATTLMKGCLEFNLSSNFGLQLARTGLSNPYSVAWELLPWSFVVDWAYPLGPYLSRLQYDQGLVFSRGWSSRKTSLQWSLSRPSGSVLINVGDGNILQRSYSGCHVAASNNGYVRTPISTMPLPKLPSFKDPFSPTHCLNALALMASSFGRGPGTFNSSRAG